ncbi:MAG: ribose 5-phosphate isomerase B [Candidatus Omnitrophica bacterium]|nr:ribose 5-phosphate isomerase B [Candidatus Omnitrophota bacterium]MBU1870143.1 ribose 5-phosphate isomerase B [Candidatus Omnitrophota bacterium]
MTDIARIAIASDHGGFVLKEKLKRYLEKKYLIVKDLGAYSKERCDYPKTAFLLADEVSRGKIKRGILICKSGVGNSIVANKLPGVRAALCYNVLAARLSREHNDSNVLVLGALFANEKLARRIIDIWLKTEFQGGRHKRRLNQIKAIERKVRS